MSHSTTTITRSLSSTIFDSNTDLSTGLSTEQVEAKRLYSGFNETSKTEESLLVHFIKKFGNLSAILLEITCLISILPFVGKYDVAIIVFTMLIFNNLVSLWQDYKARETLISLMQQLQLNARVLRNGHWIRKLPARELVPGDIIRIRMGDLVPADGTIRTDDTLVVDYSTLTGESYHRTLVKTNEVLSGASVVSGEAVVQVTRIGKKTFYGQTISLISSASPTSHTSILVGKITAFLSIFLGLLLSFTTILAIIKLENWNELTRLVPLLLLLLAGSIPVALPTMISVSTALGSKELAKRGVLTTRLDAIEDSARMDILCCDKTGTITENKLTISAVALTHSITTIEEFIKLSQYACHPANRDPIDSAFFQELSQEDWESIPTFDNLRNWPPSLVSSNEDTCSSSGKPVSKGFGKLLSTSNHDSFGKGKVQIEFIPFDPSKRRFTTAILKFSSVPKRSKSRERQWSPQIKHFSLSQENQEQVTGIVMKGSVKDVLNRCLLPIGFEEEVYEIVYELVNQWADKGWRSIAVAWKLFPKDAKLSRDQALQYLYLGEEDNDEGENEEEKQKHGFELQSAKDEGIKESALPKKQYQGGEQAAGKKKLEFAGVIAFSDPPRKESKEHVMKLKEMGINVVMLTGDELPIAREIAGLVGLEKSHVYPKQGLENLIEQESVDLESADFLSARFTTEISGLAQVLPQDKYTVIKLFQSCGHVVGMTGDGVNDAAALKIAEVGIAMSNATDVAKKAASFILTEPGLNGISSIIIEGRQVHHRIMTWILNKLVKTGITTIYIVFVYMFSGIFVVDAVHMVLLLVLVDFLTLALAMDPVREREPFKKTSLLRPQKYYFEILISAGFILAILSILEIYFFFKIMGLSFFSMSIRRLQTFHVLLLYFFSAFTTLSVRERSWCWRSFPSIWMVLPILGSMIFLVWCAHASCFPWFGEVLVLESGYIIGDVIGENEDQV